jgi:hypothetical protein
MDIVWTLIWGGIIFVPVIVAANMINHEDRDWDI